MTEDEMVGWHHWLNGNEFEQVPGVGGGQGSLVCCSPWGHKEWNTTEQLNNNTGNIFPPPVNESLVQGLCLKAAFWQHRCPSPDKWIRKL